jgi:Ribbon-helix-helix protein, copG family.
MVSKQISITLDIEVLKWLDEAAKKLGISRSAVIEMSIRLSYDLKITMNRQIRRELQKYLKK